MVDFSYKPSPAIPADADYTAPSQLFKTTPPGTLTQEHRTGPRPSLRACLTTHVRLNRIGSASPLPQPVLRCQRRSQLPRYRTPVRSHVLHSLPHGYGEGDIHAIADGTYPSTRDALGTTNEAYASVVIKFTGNEAQAMNTARHMHGEAQATEAVRMALSRRGLRAPASQPGHPP